MCNKGFDKAERFREPKVKLFTLNEAIEKFYNPEEQKIILKNLKIYKRNKENEYLYKIIDKNLGIEEGKFLWSKGGVKDLLEFVLNGNEHTERQIEIIKERTLKRLFYIFD